MGYAGYVPAKLPPGKLTGAQAALKQVMSTEALEILYKLVYNVVISPGEAKFRRIRLSNAKINAAVVQTPGALEALLVRSVSCTRPRTRIRTHTLFAHPFIAVHVHTCMLCRRWGGRESRRMGRTFSCCRVLPS